MKRLMAFAACLLLASAFAMAQEQENVRIGGKGVLLARGEGQVRLAGSGIVHLKGTGLLVIAGVTEDQFRVEGFTLKSREGDRWTFEGEGHATIRATRFGMEFDGKVALAAAGKGVANLRGKGVYKVRHPFGHWIRGEWSDDGVRLSYESPPPPRGR
ncbi:MAG: hypothetical protein HRF45_12545 [Fimbriimonadia bacterium]